MTMIGRGDKDLPSQKIVFPTQVLNCLSLAPESFDLSHPQFSLPNAPIVSSFEADMPVKYIFSSYWDPCPTALFGRSTSFDPSYWNLCSTAPFGLLTSFDPSYWNLFPTAFDSSYALEVFLSSILQFELYNSHDFFGSISATYHDSSGQEHITASYMLNCEDEQHTDLFNTYDKTSFCLQMSRLDFCHLSRLHIELLPRPQKGLDQYSTITYHDYQTRNETQNQIIISKITTQSLRMQVLSSSSSKSSSLKPYACFLFKRNFEHHEKLAWHNLTTTHCKILKDQSIPCFEPPPTTMSCPFCLRKYNWRDNLKLYMLTYIHLSGQKKKNFFVSIEELVRNG